MRSRKSWVWFSGLNLPDYPSRITSNAMEIRNVLSHNTASPDSATSPNGDSGKHNDVTPKPAIFANFDFFAQFGPFGAVAEERIKWMSSAIEGAVGSDEGAITDGDQARIQKSSVKIDVDTFADPMRIERFEEDHGY